VEKLVAFPWLIAPFSCLSPGVPSLAGRLDFFLFSPFLFTVDFSSFTIENARWIWVLSRFLS